MAALMYLADIVASQGAMNDIINQFYPHLNESESEEEEEAAAAAAAAAARDDSKSSEVEENVSGFLGAVCALEEAREELADTLKDEHTATLTQASAALTDPQLLDVRVAWCVQAEQHLRTIVENKDLLIYHLQQPLVSTFLTMHHTHHRSLVSLVGSLGDLLNRLQSHTDLLHRHAKHSPLATSDSMISSLTRVVATQRDLLSDVSALQTLVTSVLQEAGE